jgi:hypothetical protein
VNELASHGFVTFRIKAMEPVLPGTIIENIANIYFDYNPPIITEPSVLVAEFSTGGADVPNGPTLLIAPNPAHDRITLSVGNAMIESVRIIAADGRVMSRSGHRGSFIVLDISDLAPGIHIAEVRLDDGNTIQQRFTNY